MGRRRLSVILLGLDPARLKYRQPFSGTCHQTTVFETARRVFNGLVVSETAAAVALRQAEGREQAIARDQIEEIAAKGGSLMPDGPEKDVSVQQIADLLEYLKVR